MTIKNKFSLLIYLLFLIAGISFQEILYPKFYITLSIIVNISIVFIIFNKKNYKKILIYATIFFIGTLILNYQKNNYQYFLEKLENKTLDLNVTVLNKETNKYGKIKEELLLRITNTNNLEINNKKFNIILYLYSNSDIQYGQSLLIKNIKIKNFHKKPNFKNYLIKENISATIFAKNINYTILKTDNNSLSGKIYRFRKKIFENLKSKINTNNFSYFSSIFLGYKKEPINSQEKNLFNIWGISHYLARSGLHIVLFILIWQILLSLIPINLNFKNLFLLFLVLVYVFMSWTSISLLRAFYAFLLIQLGNILSQPTKYLHLLSLTCIITLLLNPIQLFFVDFQLTYGLTFTLILIGEI